MPTRGSTPGSSGSRRRSPRDPAVVPREGAAGEGPGLMGLPGPVDPEVAAVLDAVPSLDLTDIPRAREEREELAAAGRARWTPSGRVRREDVRVPGWGGDPDVRVRVHRPLGEATGAA